MNPRCEVTACVAALALGAGLLVDGTSAAARQRPTASTVIALKRWARAVDEHAPGQKDAAVEEVWGWSPAVRKTLGGGLAIFLSGLTGVGSALVSSDEDKALLDLGVTEGQTVGRNIFVERAAVLEADAVVLAASSPGSPSTDPPGPAFPIDRRSPLFATTDLVLANDGEALAMVAANWRWTFARFLMGWVHPRPASDVIVAEWYHATAAYLLKGRSWGEARGQLDHAAELVPDDARLFFDRACVSEVMGLSESQQMLTDEDLAAMRIRNVPGQRVLPNAPRMSPTAVRAGIPPADVANADAERLFRRALDVDAHLVEARVRLARLLEARSKYKDAAAELDTVLAADALADDPTLAYYAHLFAARAQRALGKLDAAAAHLRVARGLFPQAQSAMVAESALALQRGDTAAARAVLQQLRDLPPDPLRRLDPWWQSDQGPGRQADALLTEMRTLARTLGR